MTLFLLTFLVVTVAIVAMAVGSLLRRRPLSGGCHRAGMALGAGVSCGVCGVEGRDGMHNGPGRREFP